jgi:hypothetical protein
VGQKSTAWTRTLTAANFWLPTSSSGTHRTRRTEMLEMIVGAVIMLVGIVVGAALTASKKES